MPEQFFRLGPGAEGDLKRRFMAMNLKVQAAKNIGSGWFGLVVNITVGFFLSPFILHRLGNDAFGLWILVFSLTGYYGVFDLGIRSSIVKYVAQFAATRDDEQLARTINAAIFLYGCIAVALLLVTVLGSSYADSWFRISPDLRHTTRLLVLMVGSAVALEFPLSVYSGVLEGLQKFYWLNLAQVVATLTRAFLIIVALTHGRGLLTIAFITIAMPLIASALYILIVHRTISIPYARRFIDRASLWQMISFSSTTFVIQVAAQLRFQSDSVVIGIFLSSAAITFYSVGAKLVDYSSGFVDSMAQIFLPMSSHFEATGDLDRLREVFVAGNRACAVVMFPICATLIILGKSLIEAWVGRQYLSSYQILILLLVPRTLFRSQAASNRILFGMKRHRPLAVVVFLEGIVNLVLSIVFVRYLGIVGVALGTTIPSLCTGLFFLPPYLCRLLGVPIKTFLRQAYLLPLGLSVPFVSVLLFLRHLSYAHTYRQLLVQLAVGALVYGIGLLWVFFTKEPIGVELWMRFTRFFDQTFSR